MLCFLVLPSLLMNRLTICLLMQHPIGNYHDQNSAEKDYIGSLRGQLARALQSRALFLNDRPPNLLYFGEVADRNQLLQWSLQHLNMSKGASDASCAPSTMLTV